MLEEGPILGSVRRCDANNKFVIKPVHPTCGQSIEIGPSPAVLGRQNCWTSGEREKRCSRQQALVTHSGDQVEIECVGQNPVLIYRCAASGPTQELGKALRLKHGQRLALSHGDCFSLIAGGCLLRIVDKHPSIAPDRCPASKPDGKSPAKPLRERCPNQNVVGGHPRGEVRGCETDGILIGGFGNDAGEGGVQVGRLEGGAGEFPGPRSPATLRSEGSKRILATAQKVRVQDKSTTSGGGKVVAERTGVTPAKGGEGGRLFLGGETRGRNFLASGIEERGPASLDSPPACGTRSSSRQVVPGTPEEPEVAGFRRLGGLGAQRKVTLALQPGTDRLGRQAASDVGQNRPSGCCSSEALPVLQRSSGVLGKPPGANEALGLGQSSARGKAPSSQQAPTVSAGVSPGASGRVPTLAAEEHLVGDRNRALREAGWDGNRLGSMQVPFPGAGTEPLQPLEDPRCLEGSAREDPPGTQEQSEKRSAESTEVLGTEETPRFGQPKCRVESPVALDGRCVGSALGETADGKRSPHNVLETTRPTAFENRAVPGSLERPQERLISEEKPVTGPIERPANRWAELANDEIEDTPPSMKSPKPLPDRARDSSDDEESSPSSGGFRGSLEKRQSRGGLAEKSGPLLTESSEGSDSEEGGRLERGKKERWSPPPPPLSSDEERDLLPKPQGVLRGRGKGIDKAAHDSALESSEDPSGGRLKASKRRQEQRIRQAKSLRKRASNRPPKNLSGSEETFEERRSGQKRLQKITLRELPLSESDSSDEEPRIGNAVPGVRSTATENPLKVSTSLPQSSSLEKESGRRLRKVGGGQPVPGHCALPLFSRALPGKKCSGTDEESPDEDNDSLGANSEEYAKGGSPGWDHRERAVGTGLEDETNEAAEMDKERPGSAHQREENEPGGSDNGAGESPGLLQLKDLSVSSTGYRGPEKARLKRMVQELGMVYTDDFRRGNTHLVCWSFAGRKFERAREWGIPAVNHRWLEDCAWRREVVPAEGYCGRAGEDVGPLPETQPSLSPSQPFNASTPIPFELGAEAAANDGVTAGRPGANTETPHGNVRHSDSDSESDGAEPDDDVRPRAVDSLSESEEASEGSEGAAGLAKPSKPSKAAKPWAPPSPPPLEESQLDFEEWKRRNLAGRGPGGCLLQGGTAENGNGTAGEVEDGAQALGVYLAPEYSDDDLIEESGRLGAENRLWRGGKSGRRRKSREFEGAGAGGQGREKRKRVRKSSLSEQLCSSSGSGDSQRKGESEGGADRNDGGLRGTIRAGLFNLGGTIYEETKPEGDVGLEEEEDCVEVGGSEGRRPLKRLKKLKLRKEEKRKDAEVQGTRGGGRNEKERLRGGGRMQGSWGVGLRGFDPKDWVDWNSGERPQGMAVLGWEEPQDGPVIGGERAPETGRPITFEIGGDARREANTGLIETREAGPSGATVFEDFAQGGRVDRASGGFQELRRDAEGTVRFGANGSGPRNAEKEQRRGVNHVSHSQRAAGDAVLASLPSSEHPVHLPRAEAAREPSDRPDQRPRSSDGQSGQPAAKQRTLDEVFAKAGASLREDVPPRKKRRPEGFLGAAATAKQARVPAAGGLTRGDPTRLTRGNHADARPVSRTPPPAKTSQMNRGEIASKLAMMSPCGGEVACAICLEKRASEVQGVLPCGHGFCFDCVIEWATERYTKTVGGKSVEEATWKPNAKCPLCKMPYDIVTKRHVADSEGAAPEDEIVQLTAGAPAKPLPEGASTEAEGSACQFCHVRVPSDLLLLCAGDGCDGRAAHTVCLTPPLEAIPEGPWFCERCSRRQLTHALYARSGSGRGTTRGASQPKDRIDVNRAGRGRGPAPAQGIDASFLRVLDGHRSGSQRAAASLQRILPTRGSA